MATAWSIAVLLGGIIIIGIYIFMRKFKYKADATDKATGKWLTRLQIIEPNEQEHYTWAKTDALTIQELDKKGNAVGDAWPIENVQMVKSWYPEGGMFASLGLTVQKAIFIRGKLAAMVRKDYDAPVTNAPRLLGLMRNEKFIAVQANAQESANEMIDEAAKKVARPQIWGTGTILFAIAVIGGLIGLGYGTYLLLQKLALLGV